MRRVIAAAAILAAAAGCGSTATAPPSGNALVCRHYLAQRNWVRHLTYPTAADTEKMIGYVAADDGEAAPGSKLRRDLDAVVAASRTLNGPAAEAASKRAYRDCAR